MYEEDVSQRKPADDQVQKSLTFALEYEKDLKTLQASLDATVANQFSNVNYKPVKIAMMPPERVFPQDLLRTDNEPVKKFLTVIIYLCDEIVYLEECAEAKVFGPLAAFGLQPTRVPKVRKGGVIEDEKEIDLVMGEREMMMGKFLPTLQDISNFIDRCCAVAVNVVQQVSSFMRSSQILYRALYANKSHFLSLFRKLGDLLTILLTIDSIVVGNPVLQECWSFYKTMIAAARADPSSYGSNDADIARYEKLIVSINHAVMLGSSLKSCIEQNFEASLDSDADVPVRSNQAFLAELMHCLKANLEAAVTALGTASELPDHRKAVVGSYALYALHRRLMPSHVAPDAKIHKTLWSIQKTVPLIVLHQSCIFCTGEFLRDYAPFEIKKPDPADPEVYRRSYISSFDGAFSARVAAFAAQCSAWLLLAESQLQPSLHADESSIASALELRSNILMKGMCLAHRGSYLAKTFLVVHSNMQIPLSRTSLADVSTLLENVKSLQATFLRKDGVVAENHVALIRLFEDALVALLQPVKSKLTANRKIDMDTLTVVTVLESLLQLTDWFSAPRLAAIQTAVEIVAGSGLMSDKELHRLHSLAARITLLTNMFSCISQTCDTTYLYHHVYLLPTLTDMVYANSVGVNRLVYILAAFSDGIRISEHIAHAEQLPFFMKYRAYLVHVIQHHIVMPLCRDIETDLRLHIHTKYLDHMQVVMFVQRPCCLIIYGSLFVRRPLIQKLKI